MASTSLSNVNSPTGMGAGPTPLACTLSPQNGWSPKNGTIVVGHYKIEKRYNLIVRYMDNITVLL
jgi:hypothetical protein